MLARPQNMTATTRVDGYNCRRNSTVVRVNVQLSYRRILHDYPTNQHRLRMRQLRLCKTTSRDLLASPRAKKAVKLLSMTSHQQRKTVTTSNGTTISLPRFLQRPDPEPIHNQALRDACPELTDVAGSFVRKHLTSMAPNMLAGLETTRIVRGSTSEQLPSELPVVFNDNLNNGTPTVAPTHVLALSTGDKDKSNYTLFLIHQLPFAANCSAFPSLPLSSTATPAGNRSSTATLPVVRASIPSIEAFPLFQLYLYVKDPQALRAAFLPPGWTYTIDSIVQRAVLIKGFWSNASALRMLDDEMYDVVEDCWAEILRMLEQATHLA